MLVKELRKQLENMPGEMPVYLVDGNGVGSARHIFRGNLIGMEQFCEIASVFQNHTQNLQDGLIERETGFKDRKELIDAYKALKKKTEEGQNVG